MPLHSSPSIDPREIAHFEALAEEWWDPRGKFAILHKFNPVRLGFIRTVVGEHFDCDPNSITPFTGLSLLDIGCGGGLLCEPMARLGAAVTAVDASERNLKTAQTHALAQGLVIDFLRGGPEDLQAMGTQFDVILNMEVIEHVADLTPFTKACASLLRPGGLMIIATINRTPKAFALAIVAAERILGWVPKGTHRYQKLVRPQELESLLLATGLIPGARQGVVYDLPQDQWRLSANLDVNYMMIATKPR